ncbi:hypothetical protein HPP92_026968 [Vanilla planifolia]|uniref:Ribosome-recycling factor, chloroplastic n=1 Tax=Vanilla planifolia TaxID=51239 RepID=A0A835PGS2_VANPL|nr:hypothetical protein HPP92_027105 [Vanilla planifolia]KAG0450057.1 hypothetical protein HPP92_026968 [Vanilla planifolia]
MSFLLRRVTQTRTLAVLLARRHVRTLSHVTNVLSELASGAPPAGSKEGFARLGFDPFLARRGFAKGRKSKDEDSSDTVQVIPDIGPTVKSNTISLMEAAISALSRELSKIRTGRASVGMLDHIIVEAHGAKLPLNRVAVVSVIDAHTLSVTPYDLNSLKEIENAIVSSPFGINPTLGDQRLIAPIPRQRVVTKCAEDGKQSIRRARQKALETIKKSSSNIPKDDLKRLEKEVDDDLLH